MSSNGYIRVHRKMRDNWIMQDGQTLQVWMYLLMCASHKSHTTMVNGEVVKLMQGELIFGRRKCAEFLGLGEQKVRTSITRLEKAGNLTKRLTGRSTKSASVISITNWGAYQNNATPSNQQNNQETNRQLTKSQPRANQELTTIQKGRKGKEGKERNKDRASALDYSLWPSLPSDQTMTDWLLMRKRLKADATQTVINRLAPKLKTAVAAGYSVDDCISSCVERNWKGFDVSWLEKDRSPSRPSEGSNVVAEAIRMRKEGNFATV